MFTEGFVLFDVLQERLAGDDEIVMSLPLSFSPSPPLLLALGLLRLPQPFTLDLLRAVTSERILVRARCWREGSADSRLPGASPTAAHKPRR